ncbi:hypothetical protein TRFO_34301 [Tritrichomonas foetus]|uniref:Uncharacterized protein n=1 Tax=Tritrichomonas foetus TaxID=1144522 RepID=A0A1J4JKW3_9EUKA|nr:hypothetical protein TRFO_34301 [Tritrichomonas foetus]|eukprot:OHS99297.1 hypothetical protein TRFO_34301 [Tritrichomonas foetus]
MTKYILNFIELTRMQTLSRTRTFKVSTDPPIKNMNYPGRKIIRDITGFLGSKCQIVYACTTRENQRNNLKQIILYVLVADDSDIERLLAQNGIYYMIFKLSIVNNIQIPNNSIDLHRFPLKIFPPNPTDEEKQHLINVLNSLERQPNSTLQGNVAILLNRLRYPSKSVSINFTNFSLEAANEIIEIVGGQEKIVKHKINGSTLDLELESEESANRVLDMNLTTSNDSAFIISFKNNDNMLNNNETMNSDNERENKSNSNNETQKYFSILAFNSSSNQIPNFSGSIFSLEYNCDELIRQSINSNNMDNNNINSNNNNSNNNNSNNISSNNISSNNWNRINIWSNNWIDNNMNNDNMNNDRMNNDDNISNTNSNNIAYDDDNERAYQYKLFIFNNYDDFVLKNSNFASSTFLKLETRPLSIFVSPANNEKLILDEFSQFGRIKWASLKYSIMNDNHDSFMVISFASIEAYKRVLRIKKITINSSIVNIRPYLNFDYLTCKTKKLIPTYKCRNPNFFFHKNKPYDGILNQIPREFIQVVASSSSFGDVYNLIDYSNSFFFSSKDEKNSYIEFQFPDFYIQLTDLVLNSACLNSKSEHPQNFRIEVSVDGIEYFTLCSFNDFLELDGISKLCHISFKQTILPDQRQKQKSQKGRNIYHSPFFHYLRFRQTGENTGGTNILTLGKIELFGKVTWNNEYQEILDNRIEEKKKLIQKKAEQKIELKNMRIEEIRQAKIHQLNQLASRRYHMNMLKFTPYEISMFQAFRATFEYELRRSLPELSEEDVSMTLLDMFLSINNRNLL